MSDTLTRREFVSLSSTLLAGSFSVAAMNSEISLVRKTISQADPHDFILVEGHRDIYEFNDRFGQGESSPLRESMLPRYLDGGLDVIIMPVTGTAPRHRQGNNKILEGTLQTLEMIKREVDKTGDQAAILTSKSDIPESPNENKVLFFLDMEGAEAIQINPESDIKDSDRLALLHSFYDLGVRGVQLTHNERNYLADGIQMEGSGAGTLTPFGEDVVKEMNRLGMMVGVSHLADVGLLDVANISDDPIVSTHTNINQFIDTPRQHSDEEIEAIASTGGIVSVRYIMRDDFNTSYDFLIDEIDYITDLVGVEHTGVGWYGHDKGDPRGGPHDGHTDIELSSMYEQRNHFINLLRERGYSNEEISLIMGGNYLRVWNEIL